MTFDERADRQLELSAGFLQVLEDAVTPDALDTFVEAVLLRVADAVEKGDPKNELASDLELLKAQLREALA